MLSYIKIDTSLLKSFLIHFNVVYALILRETKTRFGQYQIGFLWAILEPVLWILTFSLLFYFSNRHTPSNMDMFNFLLTGLLPFLMFRTTMSKISSAISANKALLYYPQVKIIDLISARAYLELSIFIFVFCLLVTINSFFLPDFIIDNILGVIEGFVLLWLFSVGIGLLFLNAIAFIQSTDKLISVIQRPLFWSSGLFFTANELNPQLRELFLYNPVLHFIELIRFHFFIEYEVIFFDHSYMFKWIIITHILSFSLLKFTRGRLQFS